MVKKADRPEEGPACPRCQTTNRPARSFCRKCGCWLKPKALTRSAPRERAHRTGGTCSVCGETVRWDMPSCPRCGAQLPVELPAGRRKAPKAISDRRLSEKKTRQQVVAFVLARDGGRCQAGPIHALTRLPCRGRLDPHERIPRSAWSKGYLVTTNVITVCEHAHRWIDLHPQGAHALGFHGWSWERPDEYTIGVDPAPVP